MSKHTVDSEFILAAHKAACNEWKGKLEEQFPDLFETKYQKTIKELGPINTGYDPYFPVISKDRRNVVVPLPNNNMAWSLNAMEWVKKFYEKHPGSFLRHEEGLINRACSENGFASCFVIELH